MTCDPRVRVVADISTVPLFDIVVDLQPPVAFGPGPFGRRVLFGAAGGSFTGDKLSGRVLPSGGDWTLFGPTGTMVLDVRLALETDDGALVHMTYGGRWTTPPDVQADMADPRKRALVDPALYFFRTTPVFETGSEQHAWLNEIVCIGSGYLVDGGVAYRVSQVL